MGRLFNRCSPCDDSMPLIHRICLILFFCIPAFFSNTAFADYPSEAVWRTQTGTVFEGSTAHEALDKYVAAMSACGGQSMRISYVMEKLTTSYRVYWILCSNNSNYGSGYIDAVKYDKCGTTYEPYNGVCTGNPPPPTCTPPLVLDAATNTCKNPCVAGCNGACGGNYSVAGETSQVCIDNCYYRTGDGIASSSGGNWIYLVGSNTGQTCTASTGTPTPPVCPECDCIKQGKTYGTVNGAVVCVAKGTPNSAQTTSKQESTSSSSTTNKDASGATTSTDSTSQTKSESQSVNGDKVTTTTTTTTTNADGTSTQNQTEKTESIVEYCKNNPSAPLCAQKTDCDKYPDSVGCKKSSDFIKDMIGEAGADTETIQQKGVTIGSDFNFNPVSLPTSSGCPSPVTVTLAGRSVTLSYSWLCSYASAFKPLVTAFALFLAYGIVAAALRSESNKAAA